MLTAHDNLVSRLLAPHKQGRGAAVALRQATRVATYHELADGAARLASVLRSFGITRGDRVAVLMPDSIEAATVILGVLHAGGIVVPLGTLSHPERLRACLHHCEASIVIVHAVLEPALSQIRAQLPHVRHVLGMSGIAHPGSTDLDQAMAAAIPAAEPAAVAPGDVALLLYPAPGTDPELRAVPHTHATPSLALGSFARGVLGMASDDRVLLCARLATAFGLGPGLFFPLAVGAEAFLLADIHDSEAMFAALAAFAPTVLVATPSVYGQLVRAAEAGGMNQPLADCRACLSGAESLPPKLVAKIHQVLGTKVIVGYGLTESFQLVIAGVASKDPTGGIGRPVPGVETRIVNDEGNPVGPDIIGTLQIRSPTMLKGYWGRAQQAEPFRDGWFTTNDRFMMDQAGIYYFCGRADSLFKIGDVWVSPTEIERALLAHEAVWDCAVLGVEDEEGLLKPFAYVVVNVGYRPDNALADALAAHLASNLDPVKVPRWFEFRDTLPRGPSGKILRYKLHPSPRV